MSEETRWTEDPATWPSFWVYAKADLGLTKDEVHQELHCESVKEYGGTKEQAIKILKATAARKLYEWAETMPEAPTTTWTKAISPAGYEWSFTVRGGLPPYLRRLALQDAIDAVTEFEALAAEAGWLAAGALNGAPARKLVAVDGPDPTGPRGDPGTPPAGPALQSNSGRQVLETEFIKITAPKGTPRLEFWRPNRQYPEIFWALGIEAFLQLASPLLTGTGLTAEKLKKVGEQYTIPLRIEWEPSPKNPKWKDIKAVTLRQ